MIRFSVLSTTSDSMWIYILMYNYYFRAHRRSFTDETSLKFYRDLYASDIPIIEKKVGRATYKFSAQGFPRTKST